MDSKQPFQVKILAGVLICPFRVRFHDSQIIDQLYYLEN